MREEGETSYKFEIKNNEHTEEKFKEENAPEIVLDLPFCALTLLTKLTPIIL